MGNLKQLILFFSFNKLRTDVRPYPQPFIRQMDMLLAFLIGTTVLDYAVVVDKHFSLAATLRYSVENDGLIPAIWIMSIGELALLCWGFFVLMRFMQADKRAAYHIPRYLITCAVFEIVVVISLSWLNGSFPSSMALLGILFEGIYIGLTLNLFSISDWVENAFPN